jgi:hypothetical protein
MRYNAKRDANQPAIVEALRAVGCQVLLLHRVGGGVPDLLVKTRGGRLRLMEIKDGSRPPSERGLEVKQRQFQEEWKPCCCVVESVEQALREVML